MTGFREHGLHNIELGMGICELGLDNLELSVGICERSVGICELSLKLSCVQYIRAAVRAQCAAVRGPRLTMHFAVSEISWFVEWVALPMDPAPVAAVGLT